MAEVYVGVGSNIEPEVNVRRALARLALEFGDIDCSRVYRSAAFGFDGPDFLNMVVRFATESSPAAIEETLSRLERVGGRSDVTRGGSRTLDLDLLLYDARVAPGERLPREDVLAYPFVLAPLNDLAPHLRHPVSGIALRRAFETMRERVAMPQPVA